MVNFWLFKCRFFFVYCNNIKIQIFRSNGLKQMVILESNLLGNSCWYLFKQRVFLRKNVKSCQCNVNSKFMATIEIKLIKKSYRLNHFFPLPKRGDLSDNQITKNNNPKLTRTSQSSWKTTSTPIKYWMEFLSFFFAVYHFYKLFHLNALDVLTDC